MGRGMLDSEGWEVGFPAKNRAAGARLWLTKCGESSIRIRGTRLERGTLDLGAWEVGNERRARVGWIWTPRQKPSHHWGSVFGND